MFDILRHLEARIESSFRPVLCLPEAVYDKDSRPFFAAARILNFADVLLLGSRDEIRAAALKSSLCGRYAEKAGMSPEQYVYSVIDRVQTADPCENANHEVREAYAKYAFNKLGTKLEQRYEHFLEWVRSPLAYGVMSAIDVEGVGQAAHCVLGGLAATSREFFLPCVRLHPRNDTVFTAALFSFNPECAPPVFNGGVAVFADVAVVVDMTPARLADIAIESSLLAYDVLCPDPLQYINTALLSYSTRGSGEGPSVENVRSAYDIIRKRISDSDNNAFERIRITSELQFAPAVLEKAARQKMDTTLESNAAAGRANVLIAPNLDAGNMLFHLHVAYYPGVSYVLLPCGFKRHSAVDFSRSSKVEDIVTAAAAACVRIQKLENKENASYTNKREAQWPM